MKHENSKWIKVDSTVVFTTDPKSITKSFYEIFIEPYYHKESVCLDLRKFERYETIKFVNEIKILTENSNNIVFVYKNVK